MSERPDGGTGPAKRWDWDALTEEERMERHLRAASRRRDGWSWDRIGAEFGLSGSAARRFGRHPPGRIGGKSLLTEEQQTERLQKVRALRLEGWSLERIGDEVGVTKERIRQILSQAEGA